MSDALSWIGDIFRTFGQLFPRLEHVRANEVAVLFRRGDAFGLPPGLHWYWPVWSEVQKYPSRRNDLRMSEQILSTRDGKTVLVGVAVIYEVKDALKALVDTYDLENTVCMVAAGAVKKVVTQRTLQELMENKGAMDAALTKQVRDSLAPYGLDVIESCLTDGPVPAKALKLAGLNLITA